ncbi:LacI family DNA-binding transcriptional regulator [Kosmotoga pacifica]|uniref:LacI family transcriptional regulator n=1 Tax=Kosmotoga pacifica TaxID=1330330 RepID=A0A0G2ZE07_9BACT|nr:LacI family DNA-binding transcriptional regulator [Kosmotoga pacifica]AKI97043.1 LacI family transcriptional regulator [Kosmotoga pacifica]
MGKKVTISDIARRLDISPSTVSRALSGKPGVSDELRKKILSLAEKMDYIPNVAAKSLKTQKTKTIGLIISDIRNPFFLDVMHGVESVLFPRGYKFIVCSINENLEREAVYLNWLMEHGVEGILASPLTTVSGKHNGRLYKKIARLGIPVVFYDRLIQSVENFDSVVLDNETAIADGAFYLTRKGHKKIGICLARRGLYTIEERYKGFKKAVELLRIETKPEWIIEGKHPLDNSFEKLRKLFNSEERPTAIISTNHPMTRTILKAARACGLKIPEDISVLGFDDLIENELMSPPITTIRQPVMEIGRIATTLLLGRIDGEKGKPSSIKLKAELIERESVKTLMLP